MTFIRGSNPIWIEVDLSGHLFDDTFYLFILENDIPYIPEVVWQDPYGNVPWTNPIQFNANGTLPDNIYYDPDSVYRLEFRQGPTQSDPLIYLVENYVPGVAGETPVDDTALITDNQISNPQFALIDFISPVTYTSISTQVLHIAPGWFLNLTGTGSVTLTQVPLNNSVQNPTNAPYAIQIQLSGSWTTAYLSQRFNQNGILWANTDVSATIMALSAVVATPLTMQLVDSASNLLATFVNAEPLTELFETYSGVASIGPSGNSQLPPNAYVELQILLPDTCNITLSSVQIISGDLSIEQPYEQTTIERQIDQTYHAAYPIVPVGTVIDFGGFAVPQHYLACNGAAVSRTTYNQLFNTVTATETVTLTSTSATFTVASGAKYSVGMGLEGTGIPANTTIIGISTNTITMSSPASSSGSVIVRFYATAPTYSMTVTLTSGSPTFTVSSASNLAIGMAITGLGIPTATTVTNIVGTTITISANATANGSAVVTFYGAGNGDGSTTFNVYNLQGFVVAGAGASSLASAANSGLGSEVGYPTHIQTIAEMPSHSHPPPGASSAYFVVQSGSVATAAGSNMNSSTNTGSTGSGNPFTIVQPTIFLSKCIRYE